MGKKNTQVLIVGQGIAGSMLSWFLHVNNIDFIVIDDNAGNTASKTAAGIINPVTGRRVVTVWMDEVILPFAETSYTQIGNFLGIDAITKISIIDFFPNPFMRESFLKKIQQQAPYISLTNDNEYLKTHFNYELGSGIIAPAYIVHLQRLLPAWSNFLLKQGKLIPSSFYFSKLEAGSAKIVYDNIEAEKIIFCEGVQGNSNPYFSLLPFALNKGEALLIEAPEIPPRHIYKKSMTIAPFEKEGLFWVGSSYTWDFDDELPTTAFRNAATQTLKNWLKVPFKITDHKAAIRPATIERRPFVGFHPVYKNVGILNGMGTKGCSLAPYFAHRLAENLLRDTPIEKEADVSRHARILSKTAI